MVRSCTMRMPLIPLTLQQQIKSWRLPILLLHWVNLFGCISIAVQPITLLDAIQATAEVWLAFRWSNDALKTTLHHHDCCHSIDFGFPERVYNGLKWTRTTPSRSWAIGPDKRAVDRHTGIELTLDGCFLPPYLLAAVGSLRCISRSTLEDRSNLFSPFFGCQGSVVLHQCLRV